MRKTEKKECSVLHVFGGYIYQNMFHFGLLVVFSAVFAVVFWLHNISVSPVFYAAECCLCIEIIVHIIRFMRFYEKHRLLFDMSKNITVSVSTLPQTGKVLENDYQELIRILFEDKQQLVAEGDLARSEMMEYFMMWVHQIKTPISAMSLFLQSRDSMESQELMAELFRIEQYVEMVLQYLKLDESGSDLVLKRHDLDGIVREEVRKYAKLFVRSKVKLEFNHIDCQVLTDEKWLSFVIGQILSNSIKYSPKGTIYIYMEDSNRKILVIEDTGIGIGEEDLPRVFEKGFTGYNGRKDKKSTGIGLYLCMRIVTMLSHTIEIKSDTEKGTMVKIGLDTLDMQVE